MIVRGRHSLACFVLVAAASALVQPLEGWAQAPSWSKEATIVVSPYPEPVRVPSPHKTRVAIVGHVEITVEENGNRLPPAPGGEMLVRPAEILWAPDSTAFAVTRTDGGAGGLFLVAVFLLEAERVRRVDVTTSAVEHTNRRFPCPLRPGGPNVAAVAWSAGSANLVL